MPKDAYVLYVDHQGHPSPLSRCYHATASRRLSSSSDRHPPSTVTQVDSAYCPQCLAFHDVGTAASLGFCPRPTCKRCPVCTAVAVVAALEVATTNACGYNCGHCSWTSDECSLTVALTPGDDGSIGKPQLVKATEELGTLLNDRLAAQDNAAEAHYQAMLGVWDAVAKEEVRGGSLGMLTTKMKKTSLMEDEWSVEALEESMRVNRQHFSKDTKSVVGRRALPKVHLNDDKPTSTLHESLAGLPTSDVMLQSLVTFDTPTTRSELLPLPVPLRPRKSRRCRAELAEGRPGILIKPKLNPLEGDSSLRTGHGQWYKKDSSAIHVFPRLRVVEHKATSHDAHSFLLKVTNPTLGMMKLRLGRSSYQGEVEKYHPETIRVKHVLLDSLEETYADLVLDCKGVNGIEATDMIELDSMEDVLLEIGKTQTGGTPDSVESWKPPEDENLTSRLRLVATQKDSAWFELVVAKEETIELSEGSAYSVPLALEIQVGDGSWESSLIKPRGDAEGPDLATFDVLVASTIQ